jgi:PAS domain S-box-containing protein
MVKNLFKLNYHHKLIENYAKSSADGAFISNIVGGSFIFFVLYNSIPLIYLICYLIINIVIYIFRKAISAKFLKTVNRAYDLKYLKRSIYLVLLTALLYSVAVLVAILHGVEETKLLLIYVVVTAIIAGSIGTQGAVFIAFLLYASFSIIPLGLMSLYYGSDTLYIFSFIMAVFYPIHIASGYRYYLSMRDSAFIKDTFKTIFDKSSDGIVLIKNNRFLDCNESILKMFGYENKGAFLNTRLANLSSKVQADGRSSSKKMLEMLYKASKEEYNNFEWIHKKRTGEEFWVEIVLTKVSLDGEEFIHGVWRDISDRKILEAKQVQSQLEIEELNNSLQDRVQEELHKNRKKDQQLLEQSRLAQMGEMISMIAHQWRQPLAAISSTSSALELKAHLGKIDKEIIIKNTNNISKYSQHLSSTIDDFRNFFRPNKELSSVTYTELLESVLSILEVSIANKNISLVKDLNCSQKFDTHSNEIKQVILNLIKNAEDILVEKSITMPYIKLTTYALNNTYVFEVSDNGGGVAEDIKNKIFDPYFSTKLDRNGTGLGLYMSKIIIEEHCGGELNVSNNEDGAIFTIAIPAA